MWFFNKKPKTENTTPVVPPLALSTTTQDRLEIQLSKDASKEAKQKAQTINNHVKELLEENHFHVKIYIATGGKTKRKTK